MLEVNGEEEEESEVDEKVKEVRETLACDMVMTMGWNETQTSWADVRCAKDECDNSKAETDYEDCNTTRMLTCSPSVLSHCTHCWVSSCASC